MPQMMPLNWMTLFIYFIIIFMLMNLFLYYINFYSTKSIINKTYKKTFNWKW